jgi:hypothetical protein
MENYDYNKTNFIRQETVDREQVAVFDTGTESRGGWELGAEEAVNGPGRAN